MLRGKPKSEFKTEQDAPRAPTDGSLQSPPVFVSPCRTGRMQDRVDAYTFYFMGKQYNKVEKRRRRAAYLSRKKLKAKAPVVKPKARRTKKAEAAAS
jgi:hypothetical protein